MTRSYSFGLILAFWAAVQPLANFAAAASATGKVFQAGPERVALSEWSAARGLKLVWERPAEQFEVRGAGGGFAGEVDSRRILIQGVVCFLAYPIALIEDRLWIATADLSKVIVPILFQRSKTGLDKRTWAKTICLDPGHGGKDPGNRHLGLQEKDVTLKLALKLKPLLEKSGFRVVMTRKSDRYLEPEQRPVIARKHRADVFVSLHFNAVPRSGAEVRGIETYALTPAGQPSTNERLASTRTGYVGNRNDAGNVRLAYEVQRSLVRSLQAEDRGVKRQRFAVLKDSEMPAVLIEGGFLSDHIESRRIAQSSYLQKMAEAIRDGLVAFR